MLSYEIKNVNYKHYLKIGTVVYLVDIAGWYYI